LPVYLAPHRPDDAAANTDSNANAAINDPFASAPVRADQLRLQLTREGWLQPWVRVRGTEEEERQRLAEMPPLRTLNHVSGLKPGASVLMHAVSLHGDRWPALAIQNFGRGRTAALLIGD